MPLLSQTATGSRQAAARNQVIPKVGRQGVIESSRRDPQDARSRAYVPTPDNHEGVINPYCGESPDERRLLQEQQDPRQ
jgi:hypothetical protein